MQTHKHKPERLFVFISPHKKERMWKSQSYMEWYDWAVGTLCSSHYNNRNSKMHFLSVMSAVRSLLLCCEQIFVWLSRFRGQNLAICHIWQPSRYSPEGTINTILNLTEVFSLCTVHFCFIKGRGAQANAHWPPIYMSCIQTSRGLFILFPHSTFKQ